MPIEFLCKQCGELLRTADDTADRQADGPDCGAVVDVPGKTAAAPPPPPPPPAVPAAVKAVKSEDGPDNPYRSPAMDDLGVAPEAANQPAVERTGPAWERDGKSLNSFLETIMLAFTSPSYF